MISRTPNAPLRSRAQGFIISVELLLIVTILVIGSFVGLVAIRDALVKRMEAQRSQDIVVVDANGTPLGEAVGFDEHEAPLIPYIDRSVPPLAPDPAHRNFRALLGVRDDRFTSREPVYYDGASCSGTPCMKVASDENSDSTGVSGLGATGAVGYLYGLQNGPVYAIGASPDGIQGYLYRSSMNACPYVDAEIQSRYLSQKVVTGTPCESVLSSTGGPPDTTCLVDTGNACSCPQGYVEQGDVLDTFDSILDDTYRDATDDLLKDSRRLINDIAPKDERIPNVRVGEVCCPDGTQLRQNGDLANNLTYAILTTVLEDAGTQDALVGNQIDVLLQPLAGDLICEPSSGGQSLTIAESVPAPGDSARNTLDRFAAPFSVNLPIDQGGENGGWISTPPDGEGFQP